MAGADEVFRRAKEAFEALDRDALAALLADDAEIVGYDARNPPASPLRGGRSDFLAMIERMRANGLRETVEEAVVGEDGFAFQTRCRYPDGKEVVTSSFSRVRDGRIVRLVSVEAWDE